MIKDLDKTSLEEDKLWLKWEKANHLGNGIIKLINPSFYGPVLEDCLELEEKGQIVLDLTEHFLIMIPTPYTILLKWDKKIKQDSSSVEFKEMILEDKSLGLLKILKDNDQILLNCSEHTQKNWNKGKYKTSFQSMVYKEDKTMYEFC